MDAKERFEKVMMEYLQDRIKKDPSFKLEPYVEPTYIEEEVQGDEKRY